MKFNFNDINNALKYYNISDTNYINNCYKCIEDINLDKEFSKKVEEVYNILYKDKSNKIKELWNKNSIIELFDENCNPFATNVLVLLGYKLHDENMRKMGFTQKETELYKKRVYEALTNDIFIRKLKSIRISQMIWATYFINVKLIEVGRLQYENCKDYIKIHIPAGEKLEIESVIESIENSKKEIKKYFGLSNPEYRCNSWLLSNQINDIIDCNCNIHKFYKIFEVEDGEDATKDILNFVFKMQECTDYKSLPENTSLQKILKKQLIDNKKMKIGCGNLIQAMKIL